MQHQRQSPRRACGSFQTAETLALQPLPMGKTGSCTCCKDIFYPSAFVSPTLAVNSSSQFILSFIPLVSVLSVLLFSQSLCHPGLLWATSSSLEKQKVFLQDGLPAPEAACNGAFVSTAQTQSPLTACGPPLSKNEEVRISLGSSAWV